MIEPPFYDLVEAPAKTRDALKQWSTGTNPD